MGDKPRNWLRIVGIVLAVANAALLVRAGWVCATDQITIDEFNYAHAAWQTWRLGLDAFPAETWAACVATVLRAPVAGLAQPDPANFMLLRWQMYGYLLITLAAAGYIGWARVRSAKLLGAMTAVFALLAMPPFVANMIQVRPDGVAFMFTCVSLALVTGTRDRWSAARAFAAGLCLVLAVLTTQKAIVYGGVFAISFALDLTLHRRRRPPLRHLRRPLVFAAAFWLGIAAMAGVVLALGVAAEYWSILYTRPVEQQQFITPVDPGKHLIAWARRYPEVWAMAAAGVAVIVAQSAMTLRSRWRVPRDLLIAMLCGSSIVSVLINRAAHAYSYIPVLGFCGLAAGIAGHWIVRLGCDAAHRSPRLRGRRMEAAAGVAVFALLIVLIRAGERAVRYGSWWIAGAAAMAAAIGVTLAPTRSDRAADEPADRAGRWLSPRRALAGLTACVAIWTGMIWAAHEPLFTNETELALLDRIGTLTDADDVCWDAVGSYCFRPRAHRFTFITSDIFGQYRDELRATIVPSLLERRAVLIVKDMKLRQYERELGIADWLDEHYQLVDGNVYVWGKRWGANRDAWADEFTAIRDDAYFVWPPEVAGSGTMRIDGRPVDTAVFELTRGPHRVEWAGADDPPARVYIMWLPADGEPFEPDPAKPIQPGLGERMVMRDAGERRGDQARPAGDSKNALIRAMTRR